MTMGLSRLAAEHTHRQRWTSCIVRASGGRVGDWAKLELSRAADGIEASESGGIGRRTRLRIWRVTPWGFKSPLSHQFQPVEMQSARVRAATAPAILSSPDCRRFVGGDQLPLAGGGGGMSAPGPPGPLPPKRCWKNSSRICRSFCFWSAVRAERISRRKSIEAFI